MYKEVMQPHTTYYWSVHTIKASGVYTSQVYSFTTAAAAPTVLIAPANGATGVNNTLPVNFTWHAVSGAGSYRIDVSTDSTFAGYGGENFTTYLGDTSIALSLSAYNTDYFWRVSYFTGQGQSQPSEVWRFTTLSPAIDAAVLEAPAAGATGVPLTAFDFVWHPARGAVNYMLVLSTTPDPSGVIHTVNTTDTLQRFYSPTGLPLFCGETYYWCVLSYNAWGFSAMSEIRSFTFEAAGENPPLAPVCALPNNDDTLGGQLTLAWHPVPNAYDYQLFVSTTPNPVGMVLMQGVKNDTIYTINEGLNANTRYYWWVTARNFCGTTGASSEIRAFYFIDFGMLQAQSVSELSDSVLKTNVAPITDALVKIQQLDGVSFDWDTLNYPWINFDKSRQLGLIAQEVQPVFPEVVKTDGLGFNYIEYNRLVPVLIEAIKELNGKVEELQAVVSNCCSSTKTTENTGQIPNEGNTPPRQSGTLQAPLTTTDVVLESPAAILYQNVPNPFGEGTAIRYYLPGNIKSAVMVFYNEYGQEIKSVALTESGAGQLNISSVNLAAGIYTYSLVVDGKVCDTKKMMKAR